MKSTEFYEIDREHVRRVIIFHYGSLKEFYKVELGISKQRFYQIMTTKYKRKDNPAPEMIRKKLGLSENVFWGSIV